MKGYFSLNIYQNMLFFGRIPSPISDHLVQCNTESVARVIAHDVVEHDIGHRTRPYVTYENEMRAVGAVSVVRQGEFDMYREMGGLIPDGRPVKPIPKIILKHLLDNDYIDSGMIKYIQEFDDCSWEDARNATHQFAWGQLLKEQQQQAKSFHYLNKYFYFIQENVSEALKLIEDYQDTLITGVSCYFDCDRGIFRVSKKYQEVHINY